MKKLMILAALCFSVASFAAPKAATTKPVQSEVKTLKPMLSADLRGLSLYVSYDLADSLDFTGSTANVSSSGTYEADKAIGFGGQYMLTQLDNGISLDVGGTYEMSREMGAVKTPDFGRQNFTGAKPEVQFWTMYGQASALLTPRFGVFGGANYNIPQVKNVPNGTWKGKLGYFFGATLVASGNFAVDGEMRILNYSGSSERNGVTTNLDNIRLQGFNIRGRYMF